MKRLILSLALISSLGGCRTIETSSNKPNSTMQMHAPPRLVKQVEPIFPPYSRIVGKPFMYVVTVDFKVATDGTTKEIIVKESTESFYDSLVIEAIEKWEFIPAQENSLPVEVRMRQTFTFELKTK